MRAFCLSPAIFLASLAGLSSAHQQFTVSRPSVNNDGVARTMATWSYVDCGLDTDVIQLKSFEISPDPPQPGKDLTITVKGRAAERIEDGAYADLTVKLGLIKLIQRRLDVCAEARRANASVTCPVQEGEYEVVQTVTLPKEIPPAKFTVDMHAFTVDDENMACMNLKVDFLRQRK